MPRAPVRDEHILEDPKKWARALVERLRLQTPDEPDGPDGRYRRREARHNDERLEQLLEELIQGVIVADRLIFLADKAGLFKFNLKKLLNDYLNDVQVVTEFEDYRQEMLDIFREVFEFFHPDYARNDTLYQPERSGYRGCVGVAGTGTVVSQAA